MKKENHEKLYAWQRTALRILCGILVLILALLIVGTAYVEHMMGKISRPDNLGTLSPDEIERIQNETEEADMNFTGEVVDPGDIEWASQPDKLIGEDDDIINILLIGQDRRPGENRARSDSMILCTFSKSKKTLTMTSFLRDLYVQIPGYQDNRINATYAFGGMPLLDEALALNFGVYIDANIEVDFSGFSNVVDVMGGVDIELTKAEADYLNRSERGGFVAGMNHLNGDAALTYARIRKLDSDFGRTNRQRTVLVALIDKSRDLSLAQINALLDKVLPLITTDMTNAEIFGYAGELFPMLSSCTVITQHIPEDGAYRDASVRGMSVLIPDLEKARELLRSTLDS